MTVALDVLDESQYRDEWIPWDPRRGALTVAFRQPRFVVLGRVESAVPNVAELRVEFMPCRRLLEWVLFERYLASLSGRATSLEDAAGTVFDHVWEVVEPFALRVEVDAGQHNGGRWHVRFEGGSW